MRHSFMDGRALKLKHYEILYCTLLSDSSLSALKRVLTFFKIADVLVVDLNRVN